MMNTDEEMRASYVNRGREYFNRSLAARYVDMTDTGFRRRIQKIEKEQGISIPMISRGGLAKLIDKRILDQFRKPINVGREDEWMEELRSIVDQINSES